MSDEKVGPATALVDFLLSCEIAPSVEAFEASVREAGLHPAYAAAYGIRGFDGVRDLSLAAWLMTDQINDS